MSKKCIVKASTPSIVIGRWTLTEIENGWLASSATGGSFTYTDDYLGLIDLLESLNT